MVSFRLPLTNLTRNDWSNKYYERHEKSSNDKSLSKS